MGKTNFKTLATGASAFLLTALVFPSCSSNNHLPKWIQGNWITYLDDEVIHENWRVHNQLIAGENYMRYENKFQREILRIYERNDVLFYQIVIEKDTLVFTCKNYRDEDTLTFVNNSNPFPKRIIYVKPEGNKMSVWIENVKNDPDRMFFTFKKVK